MPVDIPSPDDSAEPESGRGLAAEDVLLIRRHLAEPVEPVDDVTRDAMIAEAMRRGAESADEEGCA